jgi:hypothetical protein
MAEPVFDARSVSVILRSTRGLPAMHPATAPRFLFAARDPLDFGSDKALHDARQIVIEPSLEHGAQHFTGKTNDDVAVLDKPAGEKCIECGAD